ncbi:MAG: hypothetical protein IPI38_19480 [Gemmatimonadetes bacterium]|nr:hypothetical protein [Gemmatimonadota bacterium]MBK6779931.1 hypothetical protein [Gemmatimonadota bacterium]MBK7717552.1 hypothetical protein [Gemmatimonadota bacterium]MBK7786929.1 hypothetical protein [Gemmatimonadota bacterium]MBK7922192.1 hypothetical protein [Gemmatimonadota bacterium]
MASYHYLQLAIPMRKNGLAAIGVAGVLACATSPKPSPIVGVWVVRHSSAPFQYHMYVFNGDGTMQQANPDAGNARTSDSDGKGIWAVDGDSIRGKWVEIRADRETHGYIGRGEISFAVAVKGDSLNGGASAQFYDAGGAPSDGPIVVDMTGNRVKLP